MYGPDLSTMKIMVLVNSIKRFTSTSSRLWILGGLDENAECIHHIRALTFTTPSLKVLAMESAAKHVARLSTELEKLPKTDVLRCAVEAKARDKYVIS